MLKERTRVKICGITRLEDGLAAAEAGADAIGFVLWSRSPRAVTVEQAQAIASALPPFVIRVGLFVDPEAAAVEAALATGAIDLLQFHGSESAAFCRSFDRPYIKAINVRPDVDLLQSAARYADAAGWLFDAYTPGGLPGGTGTAFDWSLLAHARSQFSRPLILSGGLRTETVGLAIRALHPWAVDVSSGVEALNADGMRIAGRKDAMKIAAFIEEVRNANV